MSPESAGKEIGKMLMRELEKRARDRGCKLLILASSLNAVGFNSMFSSLYVCCLFLSASIMVNIHE